MEMPATKSTPNAYGGPLLQHSPLRRSLLFGCDGPSVADSTSRGVGLWCSSDHQQTPSCWKLVRSGPPPQSIARARLSGRPLLFSGGCPALFNSPVRLDRQTVLHFRTPGDFSD